MTTATDYASLIERLEQGSGEDRELDFDVWWVFLVRTIAGRDLDPVRFRNSLREATGRDDTTPRVTASLDAALAFADAVGTRWRFVLLIAMDGCDDRDALPRRVLIATLRALAKDTTDAG